MLDHAHVAEVGGEAQMPLRDLFTVPNLLTFGGIAASTAWLLGGSGWWAILGLALDEIDGRVARAMNQTSEFGSKFDWGGDVAINAATMTKLGGPYAVALPVVVAGQAALREDGFRPSFGSARMITTLILLKRQGFFRLFGL